MGGIITKASSFTEMQLDEERSPPPTDQAGLLGQKRKNMLVCGQEGEGEEVVGIAIKTRICKY